VAFLANRQRGGTRRQFGKRAAGNYSGQLHATQVESFEFLSRQLKTVGRIGAQKVAFVSRVPDDNLVVGNLAIGGELCHGLGTYKVISMDDIAPRARAKISAAEVERRRDIVRQADANSRLEGVYRDPATDEIFDAYVRGDISATDMIPLLKAKSAPRKECRITLIRTARTRRQRISSVPGRMTSWIGLRAHILRRAKPKSWMTDQYLEVLTPRGI
jgi:hypothetical protein